MLNNILTNNKLIISIVNKGNARKTVEASKRAGAEGGTILLGVGGRLRKKGTLLGISVLPEKEVVLTVVEDDIWERVWQSIRDSLYLKRKRRGIAFTVDLAGVSGVCHRYGITGNEKQETDAIRRSEMKDEKYQYNLIVTILNKGDSELVLTASESAGARGGTVIFGRGTGIHEKAKLFGINIEPEKEIVFTLIEKENTSEVLNAIIRETELDKPGHGIAFIIDVEKVAGISEIDQLKKDYKE